MTRTPRTLSARARILGAILVVACVGLTIVGSATFLVQRANTLTDVDARLQARIELLRSLAGGGLAGSTGGNADVPVASTPLEPGPDDTLEDYLDDIVARLLPGRNEMSLAIVDGRAVSRSVPTSDFDISQDRDLIAQAVREVQTADDGDLRTVDSGDGAVRFIAAPVTVPGDSRVGVYMRAVDVNSELDPLEISVATYAIAASAVLAAIGIVGWFVVGTLLSPIRSVRETADSITLSELGARIPTDGNDDINDLARTVNSMLDRLEGSVDSQRQLLDDVRHELKTPITIVRGHLEMMDPADEVDVATTRDIGIAELDRLTRLVEDIDLLSAIDGSQFSMATVDVSSLTDRVGELVAVISGHSWRIESHGDGTVPGDDDRLLQAWLQLADNAAKYTPYGSPIEIGSARDDLEARVWVRDHGPGIPPAARSRIFRRFDRAHVKRSVGGSGLGLAIVDAIAKAHGGHCSVSDTLGGGATFTIHLPLDEAGTQLPAPVRAGDVVLQREATG